MPKTGFNNRDLINPAMLLDNDTMQLGIIVNGDDSDLVKLSVQSSGGAIGGNPMITMDGSANGNVTVSPNGSGTLAVDTFGEGFVISDASGNLSIGTASTMSWEAVTGTTQNLEAAHGYFANNAGTVTFTLPATAVVGDTFEVCQMHATGDWTIAQNAGQTIFIGNRSTTTGAGGTLSALTPAGDWVQIVCRVADTEFAANTKQGNVDAL